MKKHITLGVVSLTRNTFDYEAGQAIYNKIVADLKLLENVTVVAIDDYVMEPDQAIEAGKKLYSANVDAVAIISSTFHLGHLALEIKKLVNKPLLLWGLNELPYNGGKIRLNSVCGVNLNASNLIKAGYKDFVYTIGETIDEDWLNAIRIQVALKDTRMGIIGYRAHGFFNVGVDELALYKKFGCLVDHYELDDVFNIDFDKADADRYAKQIKATFDTNSVTSLQCTKVAELSAKLKAFMDKKGINALAVRCWPEFAAGYGISPCASMSLLQTEGYILACEGDIDCALTMVAHQAVGAETPFMADLSQVNLKEDFALMWHCGVAPCTLCDGVCTPTLDTYFAGGKGVTAGFVMKSGKITMARLDSINGEYRLLQECGTATPMDKLLTGTYAKVTFDSGMKAVLDRVVYSGVAHHVSMVYGDYTASFKIFARLNNIKEV